MFALLPLAAGVRESPSKQQLDTYRRHRPQSSILSQDATEKARHALKKRPSSI